MNALGRVPGHVAEGAGHLAAPPVDTTIPALADAASAQTTTASALGLMVTEAPPVAGDRV